MTAPIPDTDGLLDSGTDPVERMLVSCFAGPEAGWAEKIESVCAAQPQHADELRRRLRHLRGLGVPVPGEANEELPVPEQLGDFRLLRRLGAGGMGVVYLARQLSLDRDVALKLVRPDLVLFPGARQRFAREVAAISRLQHRGIVPVHAAGEERGVPFFAMEWLPGCTLAEALADIAKGNPRIDALRGEDLAAAVGRCASRSVDRPVAAPSSPLFTGTWIQCALRIAAEVAAALHYAHGRGVTHRDVKPSNILITEDGRAMLLDFGVASTSDVARLTRTGTPVGSLPYMSPEQVDGREQAVDPRADVYSLGVTLYELLTLDLPYLADGYEPTRKLIFSGAPPSIRERNRAASWDVETVTLTAMDRDATRRHASAADLAADLDNVLHARPVAARRASLTLRTQRLLQRHPTAAVASILGFLLLVVGPSVGFFVVRAQMLRARAESRAALATADFMVEALAGADPFVNPDRDLRVADVLHTLVPRLADEFLDEPLVRARVLAGVGRLCRQTDRLQDARALLDESVRLWARHRGVDDLETARVRSELVVTLIRLGEHQAAAQMIDELLAKVDEHGWAATSADPRDREWAAMLRVWQADALFHLGRKEAAEEVATAAVSPLLAAGASSRSLATAWIQLGTIQMDRGALDQAAIALQRAVELFPTADADATHTLQQVRIRGRLATLLARQRHYVEAEAMFATAEAAAARTVTGPHGVLAELWHNHAQLLHVQRRLAEALPLYAKSLQCFTATAGADADSTVLVGLTYGAALCEADRFQQAEPVLQASLTGFENRPSPHVSGAGSACLYLAQCRLAAGDVDAASQRIERADAAFATRDPCPPQGMILVVRGRIELARGRIDDAVTTLEAAKKRLADTGADAWTVHSAELDLAECHLRRNDDRTAEQLLLQSYAGMQRVSTAAAPETQRSARALLEFYETRGRTADAQALREAMSDG
ncbi:MAG: serine/threonine-protein kinase [Planctomycetota bacterium]